MASHKQFYLIRGGESESYDDFKKKILESVQSLLKDDNIQSISFTITDIAPPKLSVIPFKKKKIANISIHKKDSKPIESLTKLEGFSACYAVTEALPIAGEKTWPDGERTPGICLLTLFNSRKNIDYDTFIDRWHNSHTPLTLKIHPICHYSRNVVNEKMQNSTESWDGIVEEHVKEKSQLLNPLKFFGGPLKMFYNMMRVYSDTRSFIDYKSIETYLVSEYHIKSKK